MRKHQKKNNKQKKKHMRNFKRIIAAVVIFVCSVMFVGCKDDTPPTEPIETQAVGVIVYNNTPENGTYETLKENLSRISELVTISNGELSTTDKFLFYYYSPSMTLEDKDSIKTNTTTKNTTISADQHSVDLEVIYEATDVLIYIIYKDGEGNYSFEFEKEIINLNFNNTTPVSIYFEDNKAITKLNMNLGKDISKEEEYQRN